MSNVWNMEAPTGASLAKAITEVTALEEALDSFFALGKVRRVTLSDGENGLTVEVPQAVGLGVVHELLLGAIARREQLEKQAGGQPV
ncbi:hypothetical protein [Hymenobacter guriensis]|uniref:Uncharacterized protein n=1 Tax=Hymenobacter guriensis TaxID=2793065 RepID=A0ABS0KXJ0_9BACT|nr:hypothetical protein [Hymenobacter guriensis]MBG8552571.1 hypothetical protein [Hymenobacter guriensis]